MLFGGFNSQATFFDQVMRRWWIFVMLMFAVFVGILYLPSWASDDPLKNHQSDAEMARRVEERCRNLPKPEAFDYVYKTQSDKVMRRFEVDYTFQTERTEAEISAFFVTSFTSQGWTSEEDPNKFLRFSKNGETVLIRPEYEPNYGGYYLVRCSIAAEKYVQ
jgi:hypothetical protein